MSRPGTGHQIDPTALDPATSISKSAYAIAKNLDATINPPAAVDDNTHGTASAGNKTVGHTGSNGGSGGSATTDEEKEKRRIRIAEENLRQKELESEVMGSVKKGVTSQSDIKERNLSQMISVLHMRLANLEKRQKERFVNRPCDAWVTVSCVTVAHTQILNLYAILLYSTPLFSAT